VPSGRRGMFGDLVLRRGATSGYQLDTAMWIDQSDPGTERSPYQWFADTAAGLASTGDMGLFVTRTGGPPSYVYTLYQKVSAAAVLVSVFPNKIATWYASTALGLAGEIAGATFFVRTGSLGAYTYTLYQNVAGVAVEQTTIIRDGDRVQYYATQAQFGSASSFGIGRGAFQCGVQVAEA